MAENYPPIAPYMLRKSARCLVGNPLIAASQLLAEITHSLIFESAKPEYRYTPLFVRGEWIADQVFAALDLIHQFLAEFAPPQKGE